MSDSAASTLITLLHPGLNQSLRKKIPWRVRTGVKTPEYIETAGLLGWSLMEENHRNKVAKKLI